MLNSESINAFINNYSKNNYIQTDITLMPFDDNSMCMSYEDVIRNYNATPDETTSEKNYIDYNVNNNIKRSNDAYDNNIFKNTEFNKNVIDDILRQVVIQKKTEQRGDELSMNNSFYAKNNINGLRRALDKNNNNKKISKRKTSKRKNSKRKVSKRKNSKKKGQ